ncbi:MAG: hypothetical protein HY325_02660 [Chloroflexi bacterium]|nr:hypothetical protein [Chloroflexota bacterium]
MTNTEIAQVLADIADRLELRKDNWFKIRAYRKAAGSIGELPVAVEQLVREGRLKEIPGVGEAITKKITELVTSGRLEYYEKLKAEMAGVKVNSPVITRNAVTKQSVKSYGLLRPDFIGARNDKLGKT